ncbi:MAG: stage IV sporulation protein A, partial [Lachnospiraceae bacterium]
KNFLKDITYIKDLIQYPFETEGDYIQTVKMDKLDLATGSVSLRMDVEDKYYYENMSELTGVEIRGEYQLISMIKELAGKKREYEKVEDAMNAVKMKGYGVVNPSLSDITLEEPVLIKHGNKYGVKMKAVSPSIHMIKANIETEVAPIVGSEEQAKDLIEYIKEGQNTEEGVWNTNIFGKSIGELMEDGIRSKISMMDDESQMKLQDTMQKIVNDSNGGLVCIII